MAKLPHPPAELPELSPEDIIVLAVGQTLWRIYHAAGPHPSTWNAFRTFGPLATARFDHHAAPPHDQPPMAILYAALDGPTAFAEFFQATRTIDRLRRAPWLVEIELARELYLLDLTGSWPTRAGASQAIAAGRRDIAREWSRAIHGTYAVEGLLYGSSMAGGRRAVALYERAAGSLAPHPAFHVPLTHPGLERPIRDVAYEFGYRLR